MTSIVLNAFGGMVPRLGKQTLAPTNAQLSSNALLLSGELRGLRGLQLVADLRELPYEIRRLYRVLDVSGESTWVAFEDGTTDMVKAPLVNDAWDRYYKTSENDRPRMNTMDRIKNDDPWYLLGVPNPTTAPIVTATGGEEQVVTRAYVYTFVTEFGEESGPSPAGIGSGPTDGSWQLSGLDTAIPDSTERPTIRKRIYRTVTGANGIVDYHVVTATDQELLPIGQATYTDTKSTDEIGANSTLKTNFFSPPPDDMIGLVAHPNGFLSGFIGRDLHFSEPYLPHAWPENYKIATTDHIRGLGVFGTSIAVCTAGHPYSATGITPGAISFVKSQTPSPCLSDRRGIVAMPFGVYFPSEAGLMLVSARGFQLATQKLLTKTEWQRNYYPSQLKAVRWQTQYVAFYDSDDGFMFSPDEPQAGFVELAEVWKHTLVQADTLSGNVYLIRDNLVYEWNPAYGVPQVYTWRSKEFVTPKPVNFSAIALEFGQLIQVDEEALAEMQAFNQKRFEHPLNPANFHTLARVRLMETLAGYTPPPPTLPENSQPVHKSPLYALGSLDQPGGIGFNGTLTISVYADDELIISFPIEDEEMYRLPSGYKARRWVIEVKGNVDVKSIKMAETGKELSEI